MLVRFQDQMNDMIKRLVDDWDLAMGSTEGTLMPAVDVAENDNEVLVKVEMPGLKAEDINLSVRENNLVISGEKRETVEDQGKSFYHVERRYGSFYRTIPLPTGVDADKIEATCRDGILSVCLPKTEQAKPRRIPVKPDESETAR